jgi:nanoRNase/pAp phosphatase (c-di-AMP/oligoRNAs hydrolase)
VKVGNGKGIEVADRDHQLVRDGPVAGLDEVLTRHRSERHVVVLQDFPDPDAISSAYAHQLISAEYEIETDVLYSGKISHPENLALVKLLEMDLRSYTEVGDLGQYQGAAFVDNQGTTSKRIARALKSAGVTTLIMVDHHELQGENGAAFTDIRKTGATATIYAEYLQNGLLTLDHSNRRHVKAATALMHGIMTDTNHFIRAKEADFRAASFLSGHMDADLLKQITNQARSKQTLDVIARALQNRTVLEGFSISGIGYLRDEDRDSIPQAADFLITEENAHTALVFGIVVMGDGSEVLAGSLRTTRITINVDDFIKDVLGTGPDGEQYGGGKEFAGGFAVPIGFLSGLNDEEFQNLKWRVYERKLKQAILAKIGVEDGGE